MRTKNLMLAVVVALGIGLWFGSEAAQAQFTITSKSSPIFYIDSGVSPQLKGMYVAYEICNTSGTNYPDIWVNISNFTGGVVSLAPLEDGVVHLGALGAGQCKPAFFYLQASGPTTTPQSHTVSIFAAPPPGTALASATFSFTKVEETIQASANKVNTVVSTPNPPVLGGLITITVTGETGTIGAAKILSYTPASYLNWPASAFELISTSITLSGGNTGTFVNQLYIIAASSANTNYTAVYTFRITDITTTFSVVSPVAYISSGTQIKHTDTGNFGGFDPVQPPTNALVILSKIATPPSLSGAGTVTYTVTIQNTSPTHDATLDDFVDTLPTSPAMPTYVPGSSTFDGSPIPDPVITGNVLQWNLQFVVPAGTTRTLSYQISFPNVCGGYTNSFVGHIGPIQIDTTLDTTDDAPATQTVAVCALDLAIDKSHSEDFIVGTTGTYTITVTNVGTAPTTGTITVTDTLPTGLTFVSGTGSGWTCSAVGQVVTCTNPGPLAPSASSTITLTVSVGAEAVPSVTNSVSVSTPNDINPNNNSDSDPTNVLMPAAPDLAISKSHSGDFIVGTTGTYTITVTNVGSGSTTGTITVTDTLPAGLGFISGTGAGWSCSAVGQTVTCTNPGPLAPNATSTITLTVSVSEAAYPSVTNSVTVSTPNDNNPNNNSDDDPTNVLAPDLVIQKIHTEDFVVGTTGVYTITVTNVGTGPTTGTIIVTDTLPTGLSFVSGTGTNWTCLAVGQTVTCTNPGPLAPSTSTTITLTVNVESSAYPSVTNSATVSTPGDITPSNNSDDDPTTVTAPDLAVTKSHVGNFVVGQNGVYTITITNIGTAPTTGTITAIDLPPGMTFVSGTGPGWACSPTPPTITCVNHDPLPPGGSTVITLTVYVTPSAYPGGVNTVTVSTPNDTDPSNDTYDDPTDVDPVADLRLTKVVDNPNPSLGDTIIYTVTVTNDGPNTATNVEVTDQIPAGLTFVSATPSQGSYNPVTGIWTVGTLNNGASATLIIQAIVSSLGTITNTAEVTASDQLDPDSTPNNNDPNEDDQATVTTPAQLADLSLQKTVDNPTPGVGSTITFTITVQNNGPNTATNVAVQDQLPAGLTLVSATPSQGSYNPVTGVWAVGTLANGATATLTLVATVNAPGVITNIAEVIGVDQPDPDSVPNNNDPAEDDQDEAPINGQPADLTITKSHAGSFAVGQTGTYTLTVTNIGAGSTTGVITVTDTLPTGLTFVSGVGPGWTCSAALQIVTCTNLGPLAPGASTTITLTVSVSSAALPSVTNSSTVTTPGDGDPTNNTDDDPTDIVAPDLQITKSHTGDFVVGSTGVYTITVTNIGSGPTSGPIVVTDTLPTGLAFVSGVGPGWTCSAALQIVTCTNPGPLASGASTTITLTVNVSIEALGGVVNSVTVFTPDDTDPDNNSDDDPTDVELGFGQICGFKWLDLDADGNRAENEPYLPGITITLVGVDFFGNPVSMTTVTDENGQYCFTGLTPGTYVICEAPPEDVPFFETFPVSGPVCPNGTIGWLINLGSGQNVNRIKFGNVSDEPTLAPLSVTAVQAVATAQAVYFRAIGQGIREIAVELFDLSGRAIYRSGWQKNNLIWAYQNERQQRVAPGVYLYFMSVKGHDGRVIKTELRKLLVSPKPSIVDQLLGKASPTVLVLTLREGVQFQLMGRGAREFQLQVFDLSGRPIYTSDWTSTSLTWTLQNSKGQRIAKGVYLYVVTVRSPDGRLISTKIQKLIVK
jgi:uncharacterized repeat protein (TIGR01451 family)